LVNFQYPSISAWESGFKRMVTNATDFYPNGSIAYENAQQLSDILEDYKRAHQSLYHSAPHSPKMAPTGDAYSGLSFQQAQEKIVEDTINYREDPKLVDMQSNGDGCLLIFNK
jgi:hypothetical protein